MEHQPGQGGQGDGHEPQRAQVDDGGGAHVSAAPEHPHCVGGVKGAQRQEGEGDHRHHGGDGGGLRRQVEHGVEHRTEEGEGQGNQYQPHDQPGKKGQGVQGEAHLIHRVPPPRADLPAHDDGGGVADGEDGLLFKSGDANSLYQKIKFALDNKDNARELAAHGRQSAIEKFTADRNAEEVYNLYQDIWTRK